MVNACNQAIQRLRPENFKLGLAWATYAMSLKSAWDTE